MDSPVSCWVDVEVAGAVVGDGPIRHVVAWTSTARLSKAGSFSLTVAAADPRAALLQPKRVVRCWAIIAGAPTEIGAGIVDTVTATAGGLHLVVAGSDLLAELRYRSVRDLEIYDEVLAQPTKVWLALGDPIVWTDETTLYDDDPATGVTIDLTSSDAQIYIGYSEPFTVLYSFQGTGGNTVASYIYYRYAATFFDWDDARSDLPIASNTWAVNDVLFPVLVAPNYPPVDGTNTLMFRAPADWNWSDVNGFGAYWIRIDPSSNLDAIPFREFAIGQRSAAATNVSRIMDAFAPGEWTTPGDEWSSDDDATTIFSDTAEPIYAVFAGELVLAALVKIARRSGESFRLGAGRKLHWLHSTGEASSFADSAVRAVRNTGNMRQMDNPLTCLIVSLEEMRDTNDLITRIYPYGAGNGKARVSLVNSTKTAEFATAGYTMDVAENYIESDAAAAAYGRIERVMSFKDIRATDDLTYDSATVCDQLALAALEVLKRQSTEQKFYRLEIAGAPKLLQVGTRIRVIYREVHDGRVTMDIDDDFIILSTTSVFDAGEAQTTTLEIGTTDALPATDAEVIADVIEEGATYESHSQYIAALVVI